jgi:biotin transport system substrate-specific component
MSSKLSSRLSQAKQSDAPARPTTRRRSSAADLALVAVFAGLIAALGAAPPIYAFGLAVPITLQTMGVMLSGSILGSRRGALAVLLFLSLVALGLPLLSGGRGGLGVFAGPSAGYLVGFPLGAWVVGRLHELLGERYSVVGGVVANVVGGIVVVYLVGIPVQAWRLSTSTLVSVFLASVVFLPGDLAKAVVSAVVTRGVRRAYPDLLR